MGGNGLLGPGRVRRKLSSLAGRSLNFDPEELKHPQPSRGWILTDLNQPLPPEQPGAPVRNGSWEIAQRLMRGYEFADPSIVRAYYDPGVPFEGRDMLLKLKALRILHLYVGVRVGEVYERHVREQRGEALVWGWCYRTLEGHVEAGQMDWQVWKWLGTGEVEFRVHAVARPARVRDPLVRLGFAILRRHERSLFLESTKRRMLKFTELALQHQGNAMAPLREAAGALTARGGGDAATHDALARSLERDG